MHFTKYHTALALDEERVLLLNSLSGAIDVIYTDLYNALLTLPYQNDIGNVENAIVDTLKQRGYIFHEKHEEELLLRLLCMVYEEKASVIDTSEFVICPTSQCNFNCYYCFQSPAQRSQSLIMSEDMVDRAFEAIDHIKKDYNIPHANKITLFGGEPIQPKTTDLLPRIFQWAASGHYGVTVITNGYYLAEVEPLLSKYRDIFVNFQITVDGPAEVHNRRRKLWNGEGTFEQIARSIDTLLANKLRVAMRVNLDRRNINHIRELFEFIKGKRWHEHEEFYMDVAPVTAHSCDKIPKYVMPENEIVKCIERIIPPQSSDRQFIRYQLFRVLGHLMQSVSDNGIKNSQPLFRYCEADRSLSHLFSPDGLIYPCSEAMGDKSVAVGRFYPDYHIDQEKKDMWNRSILEIPECRECSIVGFCGGGCPYAALKRYGDTKKPVCNNAKKVLASYVEANKENIKRIVAARCTSAAS